MLCATWYKAGDCALAALPAVVTLDRPLALSRVRRLLRPLRTAVHHLTARIDCEEARPATPATRPPPGSRRAPPEEDAEWSASSNNNNNHKRRSAILKRRRSSAAEPLVPGQSATSSPFKPGWRRTSGRSTKKYGSRSAAVASGGGALSCDGEVRDSTYAEDLVTVDDLLVQLRTKNVLSAPLAERAEQLLRAYANILDAVYAPGGTLSANGGSSKRRAPSLVELSARQIGTALEDNLRACLELAGSDSDSSSTSGDGLDDDDDDGRALPGWRRRPASSQRTASAQEAQLEASNLQDEWYEACPASTWRSALPLRYTRARCSTADPFLISAHLRWILAEHATAIVVAACGSYGVPYAIVEACFRLCLMFRADHEVRSCFYLSF